MAQKKAKGTPKRTGKRAAKFQRYYNTVAAERKLRTMLARNGRAAAREWAQKHAALSVFERLAGGRAA